MPRFDIRMQPEDELRLGGGVKGVGMLDTCGTAAASANAVLHATGRRIRDLPIRLGKLPYQYYASKEALFDEIVQQARFPDDEVHPGRVIERGRAALAEDPAGCFVGHRQILA
jgi:hypothetical protein